MKLKHVVAAALLVFVGVSVVFLAYKEFRAEPNERLAEETVIDENPGSIESPDGTRGSDGPGHKVIVYYFHTTTRCPTCRKIEAYTTESIETTFTRQLQAGKLEFRVVNVDETMNRHFIEDYQLTTKSVILADYRDGSRIKWKNLDRVWQHVGDKQAFIEYIKEETTDYLGELFHE